MCRPDVVKVLCTDCALKTAPLSVKQKMKEAKVGVQLRSVPGVLHGVARVMSFYYVYVY